MLTTPPPHGTYSRYQWRQGRCRCDKCRRANAQRVKAWRARWVQLTLPEELMPRERQAS